MGINPKLKTFLNKEIRLTYFTAYGDESSRKTFDGELNYQAGRLFFLAFIGLFVWLAYIPIDIQIHRFPTIAIISRIGLTVFSVGVILLRFTKTFRYKPKATLSILMGYLYYATAFKTAIAGDEISTYIGGFVFTLMLPIFAPFSFRYKVINTTLSIAFFYLLAFFMGTNFSSVSILYSVADLIVVMAISLIFSYGQRALQHRAWKGYISDLREIARLEAQAEKIYYDDLTQIYNRRYFDEKLELIIKSLSRSKSDLSLLMVDIDYFKDYNDTYGHIAGDDCLKMVAKLLSDSVTRADDFVARYGGEEFVVVLPNSNEAGAQQVATKMLDNMRKRNIPNEINDAALFFTFSIGIATGSVKHGLTGGDFVKKADEMLYRSKQNGRNRYTLGNL